MQDANARPQGCCFVVLRWDGRVWDGSEWVESWVNALHFRAATSAYEDCMMAAAQAEQATGYKGVAWYIQREANPSMTAGELPDSLLRKLGAPPSAFELPKTSPPNPRTRGTRGCGGR